MWESEDATAVMESWERDGLKFEVKQGDQREKLCMNLSTWHEGEREELTGTWAVSGW